MNDERTIAIMPCREHTVHAVVNGVETRIVVGASVNNRPCLLFLSEEHAAKYQPVDFVSPGFAFHPEEGDTIVWLDTALDARTLQRVIEQASNLPLIEEWQGDQPGDFNDEGYEVEEQTTFPLNKEALSDDFNGDITDPAKDADVSGSGTRTLPGRSGERLVHRSGDGSKREHKLQPPRDALRLGKGEGPTE